MLRKALVCLHLGILLRNVDGFASPTVSLANKIHDRPLPVTPLRSEPPRMRPDLSFERPDPRILIASKPGPEQQDAVFAISGVLFLGTVLCINLLNGVEYILPDGWYVN